MAFNVEDCFTLLSDCEKNKDIVIFARRHWMSFFGNIIISIILLIIPAVALILVRIYLPEFFQGKLLNFLAVFGSAYYLMIITSIFNAWISYYYDIYILTNDLIVDINQSGFFNRKISQLSLLRVQDVSSKIEGILPTMFGYGDVLVETAGEKVENFLIPAIPNPQVFSSKVIDLHDQLIEREGRHAQILNGEGTLMPQPKNSDIPKTENIQNDSNVPAQTEYYQPEQKPARSASSTADAGGEETEITSTDLSELSKPPELQEKEEGEEEGEMDKDDLDQGGEIKM